MKDNVVETETQVLIVGGGPIGLMGSLLLSRLGVRSLVVDLRGRTSTHPRSRLLDAPSVELMREVGVEQQVIDTGLGPDWTEYNRWFDCLAGKEICRVPTPSFHSVRTDRSSSMPVMTAQDHVEAILYDQAASDPNVDLRFDTTAHGLAQDDAGVSCTIRDNQTGRATPISAEFAIGADGLRSSTRAAIGTTLEADFMDVFFQDVIFEADFSKHTSDRQGGLLFIAHPMGNAVFQPLDGVRRWRCQIGGFDRTRQMTAEFAEDWIRSALGADDPAPIEVRTMTEWQFQPGRAGRLGKGRIFLAGDAAHVFIPTGGLGNNTGFVGIRNLAWKIAFVLRGASPASLLETYDTEHQPVAEQRVAAGRRNAQLSGGIFRAFHDGGDTEAAARNCRQYGEYEGLIYGYELTSELCARDDEPEPEVENPVCDYVPVVRSGRRAPNLWLDGSWTRSVLDWNGLGYTAVLGARVDSKPWRAAAGALAASGFPIRTEVLPEVEAASPYDNAEVVLMRPDGIVADHWEAGGVGAGEEAERLRRMLPMAE
ncbi:MAG: FAD-dependent monooxygenase [Acidobacteria bacterium]|nr:FAD-dependent monooxygenase [Acidobacteriota bacterium]